jgi:hypothetical protein
MAKETIQIWTNNDRDEFAICVKGDAVMRAVTMRGILYPHLADEFSYGERKADTIDEELDAWVERNRS